MPATDPHDRAIIARIASAERWGREADGAAATAPARAGLRAKFERDADPNGTLPPEELARRADHLQRAHMLRMSRAAAAARSSGGARRRTKMITSRSGTQLSAGVRASNNLATPVADSVVDANTFVDNTTATDVASEIILRLPTPGGAA